MPNSNRSWPPASAILAIAAGLIGLIFAVGWGVARIFSAVGVMIGVISSVASNGFSSMGSIAVWTLPAVNIGFATAGVGIGTYILVRVFKEARREPDDWAVPLLSVLSALIIDLASEYSVRNQFLRMAISAVVAFQIVVAGACWKSSNWKSKLGASILILAPPAGMLSQRLDDFQARQLMHELQDLPWTVWIRLVSFLAIGSVVAMLSR